MKVIIAGSRSLKSYDNLAADIQAGGFEITELVSGNANGIDRLGILWGKLNSIPIVIFEPIWYSYGKYAGPERNHRMGNYADALIAIWDGHSKGTKDMVDYMRSLGKPVYLKVVE